MFRFWAKLLLAATSIILLVTACATATMGPTVTSDPVAGYSVNWPQSPASIMLVDGKTPLTNQPAQQPAPTASTAKIITALTVLKKKPLKIGDDGPTITLGRADVKSYEAYREANGTVVPVYDGMEISQHQILEAMLLPSANNLADSLARWSFGSLEDYRQSAQDFVRELGLTKTTIGIDASGYDPSTQSTATDLAVLAAAAMRNPVIADIVGRAEADGGTMGKLVNTNNLLGQHGLIGLKTGTTPQAGGVFLFAARAVVEGRDVIFVGAVQGDGNSAKDAIAAAGRMLDSISPFNDKIKTVPNGGA